MTKSKQMKVVIHRKGDPRCKCMKCVSERWIARTPSWR